MSKKDSKLPKDNFNPKIKKNEQKQQQKDDDDDDEEFSDSDDDSVASLVTASSSQSSSGKDVCPICLCSFKSQQSAKPEVCEHKFCLECLQEWSKKTNTCPIDRKVYKSIRVIDDNRIIKVEDKQQNNPFEMIEDVTYCEICNRCDREDILLLCDGCDRGYHSECLTPRLNHIPVGTWFCAECELNRQRESRRQQRELARDEPTTSRLRQTLTFIRPFVRTRFSERVRSTVNGSRIERGVYIVVSESETDDSFDSDEDEDEDEDDEDEDIDDDEENEEVSADELERTALETLERAERQTSSIDDAITSAIERALTSNIVQPSTSTYNKMPKKAIVFKRRKKRKTRKVRRRRTTTKITIAKDGTKLKTKVVTRRKKRKRCVRRRYRRVRSGSGVPSVQERILNNMQKAQQRQLDIKKSREINPVTLSSIELEQLAENKKEKIRGTCFPKRPLAWFQTTILNEIDESDPSAPLSSMSIIRSDEPSV